VRGAHVLDLYAGSGALGFEALSRGASRALLVESDQRAVRTLRSNIAELDLPVARVRAARVEKLLAGRGGAFDLVLADPPYDTRVDVLDSVLASLATGGWCRPGGVVVVERDGRGREPTWPQGLSASRSQRYGETVLFWARRE
jgi:16S rRNA (guanine966-N2)-methyltransferase